MSGPQEVVCTHETGAFGAERSIARQWYTITHVTACFLNAGKKQIWQQPQPPTCGDWEENTRDKQQASETRGCPLYSRSHVMQWQCLGKGADRYSAPQFFHLKTILTGEILWHVSFTAWLLSLSIPYDLIYKRNLINKTNKWAKQNQRHGNKEQTDSDQRGVGSG